jgi:hypothetical protein
VVVTPVDGGGRKASGVSRRLKTPLGDGVTWARVEEGFYVASRDGEFCGYIEVGSDGAFEAFDHFAQHLASAQDLAAAMRVVGDARTAAGTEATR